MAIAKNIYAVTHLDALSQANENSLAKMVTTQDPAKQTKWQKAKPLIKPAAHTSRHDKIVF